jgi:hypothetical protein
MGYTTYFDGKVTIDPPLNPTEIKYLEKFADTRRMKRDNGPYYVGGTGFAGQGNDPDIIDFNRPPEGQPGLWCHWVPANINYDDAENVISADAIEWDGSEKFYDATEWMQYIIDHFIGPNPLAKLNNPEHFGFLQGHTVNGEIKAEGEEPGDHWKIVVKDSVAKEVQGHVTYDD